MILALALLAELNLLRLRGVLKSKLFKQLKVIVFNLFWLLVIYSLNIIIWLTTDVWMVVGRVAVTEAELLVAAGERQKATEPFLFEIAFRR